MKYAKVISLILVLSFVFALSACGKKDSTEVETTASVQPSEKAVVETDGDGTPVEMLAVYFPYDPASEKTAKAVADATGAKLFALETVNGYSDNSEERASQAKDEAQQKSRPALKNTLDAITPYSVLFVCTPLWEDDMPMAVYTFFEDYDLRDRAIVPLCVSDGENSAEALTSLVREKLPASIVTDGMAVTGSEPDAAAIKAFIDNALNG